MIVGDCQPHAISNDIETMGAFQSGFVLHCNGTDAKTTSIAAMEESLDRLSVAEYLYRMLSIRI